MRQFFVFFKYRNRLKAVVSLTNKRSLQVAAGYLQVAVFLAPHRSTMETSGNSEENIVLSDDKDDNSCTIMEEDVAKKTGESFDLNI